MFNFLKSLMNTKAWNDEPAQQELMALLLKASTDPQRHGFITVDVQEVIKLASKSQWTYKEAADRCVHAASALRGSVPDSVYRQVKLQAQTLYDAFRKAA